LEAVRLGSPNGVKCPNCHSTTGVKINKELGVELIRRFFWMGSYVRTDFGGASRIISNEHHYHQSDVELPIWLQRDATLLQDLTGEGLFYYGPPLWRLGIISPLTELQDRKTKREAAARIVASFPTRVLKAGTPFYRIRKNLPADLEQDRSQYDTSPYRRGFAGRLDSRHLRVMYASEDLEICVHECRTTVADVCYVATLKAERDLKLLDFCAEIDEAMSPFESIALALRFLFSAEAHSYPHTQLIAEQAAAAGYEGLVYPSYFSLVKATSVPNLAIFGFPIRDGAISVSCINRAMLDQANYSIRFGPVSS
jgi:hypothetical protein